MFLQTTVFPLAVTKLLSTVVVGKNTHFPKDQFKGQRHFEHMDIWNYLNVLPFLFKALKKTA